MTEPKEKNRPDLQPLLCEHCHLPKSQHWAVNYADGPHVSGVVLVCPTGVFK